MDKIKIEDFARDHPNKKFPAYRTLDAQEAKEIRFLLAERMGVPADITPLDLVKQVTTKSTPIPHVNAEDDGFSVIGLISELGVNSKDDILINWYRYDHIDEMRLSDVSRYLDDLWYPVAEEVDLFDESLKWILSIEYSGAISILEL